MLEVVINSIEVIGDLRQLRENIGNRHVFAEINIRVNLQSIDILDRVFQCINLNLQIIQFKLVNERIGIVSQIAVQIGNLNIDLLNLVIKVITNIIDGQIQLILNLCNLLNNQLIEGINKRVLNIAISAIIQNQVISNLSNRVID